MRGEEWCSELCLYGCEELPPHARRRGGGWCSPKPILRGITSACAEKRSLFLAAGVRPRNYLRMRGEECKLLGKSRSSVELPPHARRRVHGPSSRRAYTGITSACAEKSFHALLYTEPRGNYLRMRGEESVRMKYCQRSWELPPHARRRACMSSRVTLSLGITSACAEKRP